MYSRFLKEAAGITNNKALAEASAMFHQSGTMLSEIGLIFQEAETMSGLNAKIEFAAAQFSKLADNEEKALLHLKDNF